MTDGYHIAIHTYNAGPTSWCGHLIAIICDDTDERRPCNGVVGVTNDGWSTPIAIVPNMALWANTDGVAVHGGEDSVGVVVVVPVVMPRNVVPVIARIVPAVIIMTRIVSLAIVPMVILVWRSVLALRLSRIASWSVVIARIIVTAIVVAAIFMTTAAAINAVSLRRYLNFYY